MNPKSEVISIKRNDPLFPASLTSYLGESAPEAVQLLGHREILDHHTIAVFSSGKCPGKLIIRTSDLMMQLRLSEVAFIGGFHSPVERECLSILLAGKNPVIICLPRSLIRMRVPTGLKTGLVEGRLAFLSCFTRNLKRATSKSSEIRNLFAAALADIIFVAYAAPNSMTERLAQTTLAWGKPVYTIPDDKNQNLLALGAKAMDGVNLVAVLSSK